MENSIIDIVDDVVISTKNSAKGNPYTMLTLKISGEYELRFLVDRGDVNFLKLLSKDTK